jgi:hypothetical protein
MKRLIIIVFECPKSIFDTSIIAKIFMIARNYLKDGKYNKPKSNTKKTLNTSHVKWIQIFEISEKFFFKDISYSSGELTNEDHNYSPNT